MGDMDGGPVSELDVVPARDESSPESVPVDSSKSTLPSVPEVAEDLPSDAAEPEPNPADGTSAPELPMTELPPGEPSGEVVASEAPESLDDIPPAPHPAPAPVATTPARVTVPWWPFLVYLGLWVILAGLAVWQFLKVPVGQPVYDSRLYGIALAGGLAMTAAGVLLILAVWLSTALAAGATKRGALFVDSFVRGAVVTFVGVLIWWIALVAVDYLRLGRPF